MVDSPLPPDEKKLWTGTEWISASQQSEPRLVDKVEQTINQIEEQLGLDLDEILRETSNFDITLDEYVRRKTMGSDDFELQALYVQQYFIAKMMEISADHAEALRRPMTTTAERELRAELMTDYTALMGAVNEGNKRGWSQEFVSAAQHILLEMFNRIQGLG
jgi:hypothetical protein